MANESLISVYAAICFMRNAWKAGLIEKIRRVRTAGEKLGGGVQCMVIVLVVANLGLGVTLMESLTTSMGEKLFY